MASRGERYTFFLSSATNLLNQSFNPITNLISSLRRVSDPLGENSTQVHRLHSLLEPLLLSTRAASDKYRTELVQILADGGGAGEQEEMMMWYAYEYERTDSGDGKEVDEEKWPKTWLERLERREYVFFTLSFFH